ncbi:MAG: hypothetical protein IJV69_07615 [Kiritimatiellae bacterium]|nr:hypothetical protein [Kiritimatiellia bacterium]
MKHFFNRHNVGLRWSFVVFLTAFFFYLLTAAFVPYPGLSSEYVTALTYPAHAPELLSSPTDVVLLRALLFLVTPADLAVLTGLFQCLIGALIVTGLFRAATATVRHACLDLTGIRQNELDRILFVISKTAVTTGLGVSLLTLTLLPLWVIATRPYPESCAALIAVATLAFALVFRRRAVQAFTLNQTPRLRDGLFLFAAATGITFLALTHTSLIVVALFAFLIACKIFLNRDVRGRLLYAAFLGGGIVLGLICSIIITASWAHLLNVAQAPLPNAIQLWATHFTTTLSGLVPYFSSFEGLAPLILFLSAAALFWGCFPFAFLKFGTPIIGQLAGLALGVAFLLRWPTDVWQRFEEPDALCVVSGCMALLCLGLLIGSWLHHFLEMKQRWTSSKVRLVSLAAIALVAGTYAITQGVICFSSASGRPMQAAMEEIAPILDALLPEKARIWITSERDTFGIIARRTLAANPIQPQSEDFSRLTAKALYNHTMLSPFIPQDPLLPTLAALGGDSLRQYLLANQETYGILTRWDARVASVELARAARLLAETPVATTVVGQHCITQLNRLAAREHAICAIQSTPEVAVTHLRLARTLDPGNPGVCLSLAALENLGISVTQAERDDARDILEATPIWRAPSEEAALIFEYRYGPVTTQAFCSASRLRRFHLGDAPAVLEEILHLYRTAPAQLSSTEHLIAILHLPEAEAAERVATTNPECSDMELFFCLYPDNPVSEQLYSQYGSSMKGKDALTVLFRNRTSHLRDRTADKMLAFFLRDGTFAYALYHLNALLKENRLEDAVLFAESFNVRERLARTPTLIEELRYRTLVKLSASAPERARDVCQGWLRSNPKQYRLWSLLLSNENLTVAQKRADIEACLLYYPLHPIASRLYADILENDLGTEVAERYRNAIQTATEAGACIQKDAHAHSRF